MRLTTRQQKLLKWLGYPLLAIVVFVFALAYTFPYDRLKGKIIEGLSNKYDVSIESIEPSLIPGTFTIHNMVLSTRPTKPDEKPVVVAISEVEVNVGVFSAIFWTMDIAKISVEVNAKISTGEVAVVIQHEKGNNSLAIDAQFEKMPMDNLPGVAEAVGLPMTGLLTAGISLELPRGKWSKAEGEITLDCISCTVGDGKAQIKMKPPLKKRGTRVRRKPVDENLRKVTVPKINLGQVEGLIVIKKGTGVIEKFSAKSKDGYLNFEGEINFKDPFKETLFPGCLKFAFSDTLKERESSFWGIQAGLPQRSKKADGSYAIPTKGKLVDMRFDLKKQCKEPGKKGKTQKDKKQRPTISATKNKPRKMPTLDKDLGASKGIALEGKEDKEEIKGKTSKGSDVLSGPKLSKKFAKDEAKGKESDDADDDDDEDEAETDDDDDDDDDDDSEDEDSEEEDEDAEEGSGDDEDEVTGE